MGSAGTSASPCSYDDYDPQLITNSNGYIYQPVLPGQYCSWTLQASGFVQSYELNVQNMSFSYDDYVYMNLIPSNQPWGIPFWYWGGDDSYPNNYTSYGTPTITLSVYVPPYGSSGYVAFNYKAVGGCGKLFSAPTGVVSDGYPIATPYPNGLNCIYIVQVDDRLKTLYETIDVTYNNRSLDADNSDTLAIGYSIQHSSNGTIDDYYVCDDDLYYSASACNQADTWSIPTDNFFVSFSTYPPSVSSSLGFEVTYEFVYGCEDTTSAKNTSFASLSDGSGKGFPMYPYESDCVTQFTAPKYSLQGLPYGYMEFSFEYLRLYPWSKVTFFDTLHIAPDSYPVAEFSGNSIPQNFTMYGTVATLRLTQTDLKKFDSDHFITAFEDPGSLDFAEASEVDDVTCETCISFAQGTVDGDGFEVNVRAVPEPVCTGVKPRQFADTCNGFVYDGASNYNDFASCEFVIEAGFAPINLTLSLLDMHPGDSLKVYKGRGAGKVLVQTLTGSVLPSVISIASNTMTLSTFGNGNGLTGAGFAGTWVAGCPTPEEQKEALVDLYKATGGSKWSVNFNWLSDDFCSYYGVFCKGKYIDSLDLSDNLLDGTVPSSFGKLAMLKAINLAGNRITAIPDIFQQFSQLRILDVSGNWISTKIPSSLFLLPRITKLAIDDNDFVGSLPTYVPKSLNFLNISSNHIRGDIPDLSNITRLEVLDVSYNNFAGTVPAHLVKQQYLRDFKINNNQFSTPLPDLVHLTNVRQLYLGGNLFEASFPPILCNMTKLTLLDIGFNQFSGTIPSCVSKLTKLQTFIAIGNKLSGTIPSVLSSLTKLAQLLLDTNQLSGTVPLPLWNLPSMKKLSLSYNSLDGALYPNLPQNLVELDLSKNNFHGTIPVTWAGYKVGPNTINPIRSISLSGNRINGTIPINMRDMPLENLDLSDCQISGTFPARNKWWTLKKLSLNNNEMTGSLPTTFCNLTALTNLDIASNNFTGKLPACLRNLVNIRYMSLAYNSFSGPLPQALNYPDLRDFQIQRNYITGPLPSAISYWESIQTANLAYNLISDRISTVLINFGELPELSSLNLEGNSITGIFSFADVFSSETLSPKFPALQILNLAQNDLEGTLPEYLSRLSSLTQMYLQFNPSLHGPLPESLSYLEVLDIRNTSMSSSDTNSFTAKGLLPSWLKADFTKTGYVDSNHFFHCAAIEPETGDSLNMQMNADYFFYRLCVCDTNYYGKFNSCVLCPANAVCTDGNVQCIKGYIGPLANGSCIVCPLNAECNGTGTTRSVAGYWAPKNSGGKDTTQISTSASGNSPPAFRRRLFESSDITSQYAITNYTDIFYKCPNEASCLSDSECLAGTEGYVCAVCALKDADGNRWYPTDSGSTCTVCPPKVNVVISMVIFGFFALFGIELLFIPTGEAKRKSAKLKIILSFLQILASMSGTYDIKWDPSYLAILSYTNIVNFDLSAVVATDCLNDSENFNYYAKFSLSMFLPMACLLFVILMWAVGSVFWIILGKVTDKIKFTTLNWTNLCFKNAFVLLLLVHPAISSAILKIFKCRLIDGKYFLDADYTKECLTPEWFLWATIASVFLVIYICGIPLLTLFVLLKNKHNFESEDVFERYGFIFSTYSGRCFYWEIIEIVRKLFLVGVIIFIAPGTALQIAVALAVCFLALVINEKAEPFEDKSDHWLQSGALYQLCVMLFAGLLYKYYQDACATSGDEDQRYLVLILLIILQVTGLLLMLGLILFGFYVSMKNAWHDFLETYKGRRIALKWDYKIRKRMSNPNASQAEINLYEFLREHHTLPYIGILPSDLFNDKHGISNSEAKEGPSESDEKNPPVCSDKAFAVVVDNQSPDREALDTSEAVLLKPAEKDIDITLLPSISANEATEMDPDLYVDPDDRASL